MSDTINLSAGEDAVRLKCGSARHHRLWSTLQLNNSTEADAVKDDSFRGIHDDDDCKVVYSPTIQDSNCIIAL